MSMSSLSRGSKSGSGGGGGEADEAVAYDKVLARLIKGLDKAASRIDDKQLSELGEACAGGLQDAGEASAELSGLLHKMAAFQSELKRLTLDLRTGLERGALGPLKVGAAKPSLKEALAAVAAHGKATEAVARDEKVHETRHTADSKTKLSASQEQLAEKQAAMGERLAAALPDARQALREALSGYAQAYAAFFSDAQKAGTQLAAGVRAVRPEGGAAGGGGGVFGSPVESGVPRFVDEALSHLLSKDMTETSVFREAPPQATDALRAQVEAGTQQLGRANVLAVAAVLKSWFAELPEPLLSHRLHDRWMAAANEMDNNARLAALRSVARDLPAAQQALLGRLMKLLDKTARAGKNNGMHAPRLAALWAPVLLRSSAPVAPELAAEDAAVAANVVLQLICSHSVVVDEPQHSAPAAAAAAPEPKKSVPSAAAPSAVSVTAEPKKPAPVTPSAAPAALKTAVAKTAAVETQSRNSAPVPPVSAPLAKPKVGGVAPPGLPPKKKATTASSGAPPKRALPTGAAPEPGARAAGAAPTKPKAASPRKAASPPAHRKAAAAAADDGGSSELSDSGEGGSDGGGVAEEEDMVGMRHATSSQDVEDMQSLGILGMMLSQEKRVGISPALDRKSSAF